jgi:type II secretory pathway component PulJ
MGFSTILDIIGSIIMGGFLLLLLWKIDDSATQNVINNSQEVIMQQNLTTVATILENDFRRLAYCAKYDTTIAQPITQADSNSITFLADIDGDSTMNSISYYLGDTTELASTPNPRDRLLYRVADGVVKQEANLGVTKFKLIYFDVIGDTMDLPIADLALIKSVEISLTIEDSYAYNEQYSEAFWRQIRVASNSLHTR